MVAKNKYEEILRSVNLSVTRFRLRVLEQLALCQKPISRNYLLEALGPQTDRVTLYRTLRIFCEQNLVDNIDSDSGGYYVIKIEKDEHNTNHLHFECTKCHRLFCIPEITGDLSKLPNGFNVISFQMIAKGLCKDCQ